MYIAFIGSRQPTKQQIEKCLELAREYSQKGWTLVTGGADGIDLLAAENWESSNVIIYLPWRHYNHEKIKPEWKTVVFDPKIHKHWLDTVQKYHPAPHLLADAGIRLHARNFGIIEKADVVIAFPSKKPGGGGTGQGIRIARELGKKLYVFHPEE